MEQVKNTPRDTFLYILAIITLVASAVTFGTVVYQFINLKFPDVLMGSTAGYYDIIRGAVAGLVVVFPVFLWVSRFLRRDVVAHPEKKDLKIRRWLMYLTVFAASIVVIVDLVTLISSYLRGDLTTAFILKVIVVFFIAGCSFFYYLSELQDRAYPRKAFQWTVIVVVLLAIVYGFYVAGSPQNQRLVRLDDQKVSNLQMIQDRLVYYWQQKGSLPEALGDLNDPISGFSIPVDPQGQVYEYRPTGQRAFELCATFNLPSRDSGANIPAVYGINSNWQHGQGRTCFARTIDQALYPIKSPMPAPIR